MAIRAIPVESIEAIPAFTNPIAFEDQLEPLFSSIRQTIETMRSQNPAIDAEAHAAVTKKIRENLACEIVKIFGDRPKEQISSVAERIYDLYIERTSFRVWSLKAGIQFVCSSRVLSPEEIDDAVFH